MFVSVTARNKVGTMNFRSHFASWGYDWFVGNRHWECCGMMWKFGTDVVLIIHTETERPSDWQPLGLSHGRLSGVTRLSAIKPDSPGRHIEMTATAASLSTMVITWSTKRLSNLQPLGLSWDSLGCQTTMTAMDVALSTKVFIWSALVFTFECSSGHLWW